MNQILLKEAPKQKGANKKISQGAAGLFMFVSVFAVSNAQADSKQDIAELEAFYAQVFGSEQKPVKNKRISKKTTRILKKTNPVSVTYTPPAKVATKLPTTVELQHLITDLKQKSVSKRPTYRPLVIPKQIPSPSNSLSHKDPELVAFYERVFGKHINKKKVVDNSFQLRSIKRGNQSKADKLQDSITNLKQPINRKAKGKVAKKASFSKKITLLSNNASTFDYSSNTKLVDNTDEKIAEHIEPATPKVQNIVDSDVVFTKASSTSNELQNLINKGKKTNYTDKPAKTLKVEKNESPKKYDLAALHSQAFGKAKSTKVGKPSSNKKATNLDALFAKAFGKKKATSAPTKVSVDLKINQTKLGDVTVFSNPQGVMETVETENLLLLLKDVLKEHVYKRVIKKISSKKKIPFKALSPLGVKAAYNSVDLSLDLQIKPELRKPLILSMGAKRKASVREENKIDSNDMSAYLNMYSNVTFLSGSQNKPDIKMKLEGSLNIGNTVFESSADLRGGKLSSNKTTLTYDKADKLQRFMLGNVATGNRNFQENLKLDGIRVSKEFFMDPDLQIRPKANESFVLDSDSEIEVFINNQLRQRFYLRAGIYSLEDIGLYDGANNIRVRIKDEFGKVTVKNSEQYYDSHLLKKGLSLYAFTVGYLSNKQAGANELLKKKPIISAYYQKGISKDLTMSFDAQVSSDSYLLGSEVITSIPFGSIKSSLAISGGREKSSGIASRFEFKPNRQREQISLDTLRQDMLGLQTSAKGFLNNWTVSGELRSRNFSLLNGSDSIDFSSNLEKKSLKARLQTNFSLDLGRDWRGTLNLGVSDYYDADKNISANLTATKRFNNGMSLSLGARYDSDDDYSMNLQLSIPLFREKGKRKKSLDFLANTKDNSLETKLNIKPMSLVGKNSFGGSLEHIQNDKSRQQNLDMHYRNTKFETKLSARNRFSKANDEGFQQLTLGLNSSIACVGSNCATSYPIEDSFALVSGPSNQEGPIAINDGNNRFKYSDGNDTGLPDDYIALIPDKDSKAVVRLESYRFQNINIDESTLPDGYDTEKTEFEVFPRYHQGFLIKAGGEPMTILDGVLVDEEKKPLGFKGGQWVPISGEGKAIAFFSNKAGHFRITSMPTGKYKLELFDYPDMEAITVAVPDLKGKVHDLGNLRVNK